MDLFWIKLEGDVRVLLQIGFYFALSALLVACGDRSTTPSITQAAPSCRGIYFETDAQGNLRKFNQYWQKDQAVCLTDQIALTSWESSLQNWTKNKITCKPQPQIQSQSLVASGNYYSYRDSKVYLSLDAATGVFRRLVYGEDKDGSPLFTKLQGCFYVRNDSINGNQLLLDTVKVASSEHFDPVEIFYYTQAASGLNLVRYDQSGDWDSRFCAADYLPEGFCDFNRNGNVMFWPSLTNLQKASLLNEAILIRKTYSYAAIALPTFETAWSNAPSLGTESSRDDFKYQVIPNVDTPLYISDAWYNWVKGLSNTFPDTSSSQTPLICYRGSQSIVLSNGNLGRVYGEICYVNGVYTFTQN
jgi:hypothetical protein